MLSECANYHRQSMCDQDVCFHINCSVSGLTTMYTWLYETGHLCNVQMHTCFLWQIWQLHHVWLLQKVGCNINQRPRNSEVPGFCFVFVCFILLLDWRDFSHIFYPTIATHISWRQQKGEGSWFLIHPPSFFFNTEIVLINIQCCYWRVSIDSYNMVVLGVLFLSTLLSNNYLSVCFLCVSSWVSFSSAQSILSSISRDALVIVVNALACFCHEEFFFLSFNYRLFGWIHEFVSGSCDLWYLKKLLPKIFELWRFPLRSQ